MYDVHAGVATGVCLQKVMKMCAKVWICKILLIHTYRKCVRYACRFCNWSFFAIMCAKVKFHTCAKCVRCACRFCNWSLFAIMCPKVWMHEILHIHTRAKCAHAKCVQCACRFCNWSLFAIMCAKVWMCEILHIHTRAKCVPFLSLLCYQLSKYRRANLPLLIYLHTKLPRLLWKKLFYKSKSTSIWI